MKLKDLKKIIDIYNDKGKGDFVVKVDLEEISIGATASS